MDLLVELRVLIAEHALTSWDNLRWYWLDYMPSSTPSRAPEECLCTFLGLESLTSRCRVSRQLYDETAPIAWKINELLFEEGRLGPTSYDYGDNEVGYAYSFFLRTARRNVENIRSHT
jgi:hypothetical protein